jgi:hypothetical protein
VNVDVRVGVAVGVGVELEPPVSVVWEPIRAEMLPEVKSLGYPSMKLRLVNPALERLRASAGIMRPRP